MRNAHLLRAAALAGLALLAGLGGCTSIVVKPLPAMDCPVDAALLAKRCAAPLPVADGISFGDVLQVAQRDRQALADCRAREAALVDSVQACQQAIARFNDEIAQINRANSAGR